MGNLLKVYFSRNSLSVSELARRSGVSKSYLSMIANGKRRSLSPQVLARLSKALEQSPSELEDIIKQGVPSVTENSVEAVSNGVEPNNSVSNGVGSNGAFFEGSLCVPLEEALNAWLNNNLSELTRLSRIIAGMDETKVPLKQNFLWWYDALKFAWQNRFDDSLDALEKVGGFKPTSPLERRFKAKIIGDIGSVCVAKGNYTEALKRLRLSLILWGEGEQAAVIYLNLGTLFRRTSNYPEAIESYEKAVTRGSDPLKLLAYSGLGQVCMDKKDRASARWYLLRGYALSRKLKGNLHKGDVFCNLGKYYKDIGKVDRAVFILKKGVEVATGYGNLRTKLYVLTELADAYMMKGDLRTADQTLSIIEQEQAGDGGDVLLAGSCLTTIAKKYMRLGQLQQSLLVLNKCYLILSKFSPTVELETCCDLLRKAYLRLKKPQVAFFYESELKRIHKFLK